MSIDKYFVTFLGDKVLVFSQSLLSLDLIEKFLSVAAYDDTYGTWNHGKDYFRMDGSTGRDFYYFFMHLFIF